MEYSRIELIVFNIRPEREREMLLTAGILTPAFSVVARDLSLE